MAIITTDNSHYRDIAAAIREKAGGTALYRPAEMAAAIRDIQTVGEPYDGPYDVTPKVMAQTLPTAKKLMRDDVSVRAIPYFDVSNPAGGNTIYIANEV